MGVPGGEAVSYERGTPVGQSTQNGVVMPPVLPLAGRGAPARDPGLGPLRPTVQGYLAHKKQPPPLGPPYDPRYSPTVGS